MRPSDPASVMIRTWPPPDTRSYHCGPAGVVASAHPVSPLGEVITTPSLTSPPTAMYFPLIGSRITLNQFSTIPELCCAHVRPPSVLLMVMPPLATATSFPGPEHTS